MSRARNSSASAGVSTRLLTRKSNRCRFGQAAAVQSVTACIAEKSWRRYVTSMRTSSGDSVLP